jgi:hypothetical protein
MRVTPCQRPFILRQNAYCRIRIGTSRASDVSSPSSVPAGIVVPEEAIEQLAAGKRPPVLLNVNGYEYRNPVGVMGGKHMISISAAVRNATGLKGEDPIRVTLTIADTPQEVTLPADLAAAPALMSKPAQSSVGSPRACSGITPATSPPPRAPTPSSVALIRPLPCSARQVKVTAPAHQAKSDVGRPLGHERCRHRSPRSAQHRIATLAAKLPTISGGYFARVGCLGVAGIPEATALAGSGQGASFMARS